MSELVGVRDRELGDEPKPNKGGFIRSVKVALRRSLPPKLLAACDFLRPSVRSQLGEPFNGQHFRQEIFFELLRRFDFEAMVETGTFHGTTTEFLAKESRLPVYTVEFYPRFFYYAKLRLRHQELVHMELGDSREFIQGLAKDSSFPKANVFFYLDAHWYKDLPLREEVELISHFWRRSVIMIDDFEVPGDNGYRFDEYGGRRLSLEYLQPLSQFKLIPFFPSVPSKLESGWRMGCVVLTDEDDAERLADLNLLQRYLC